VAHAHIKVLFFLLLQQLIRLPHSRRRSLQKQHEAAPPAAARQQTCEYLRLRGFSLWNTAARSTLVGHLPKMMSGLVQAWRFSIGRRISFFDHTACCSCTLANTPMGCRAKAFTGFFALALLSLSLHSSALREKRGY
jgi:hypothetical protein